MKKTNILGACLLGAALISGCQQEPEQAANSVEDATAAAQQPKVVDLAPATAPAVSGSMVSGTVAETMDAGGYTYVRVDVAGEQLWAAGPVTPIKVGDTISFSTLIPMRNFHSNAMNRDFPVLYFVDGFSGEGTAMGSDAAAESHAATPAVAAPVEQIEKVAGGYTIAEAWSQKAQLAGKPIKVRGKVTKFTGGIMGKNWIHMVDGSGPQDLIVTTTGSSKVGDVIVANGALSLDRDFGFGYRYEMLMEDAAISIE